MDARIRIAAAIWLAMMLLAIPAAGAMFLLVVSTLNLSGHGEVSATPILVVALVPPIAAAAATRLTSAYVARASNQQIHAGPAVLGCFAGFLLGAWLGSGNGAAVVLMTIAMLSMAGTVAGTLVQLPVRPLAVGIAAGIVTELIVLLGS